MQAYEQDQKSQFSHRAATQILAGNVQSGAVMEKLKADSLGNRGMKARKGRTKVSRHSWMAGFDTQRCKQGALTCWR
eukprot:6201808-Pleurochrysis_carterae.AAC.1